MDSAMASIKKKNKNVSSQIVDALEGFCVEYLRIKEQAPEEWFKMPLWLKQSPDFLILYYSLHFIALFEKGKNLARKKFVNAKFG